MIRDVSSINSTSNNETYFIETTIMSSKPFNKYEINNKSDRNSTSTQYDPQGAANYVVVVIIWYFLSVALFVIWQIKSRKGNRQLEFKNQLLLQAMEEQVKTKQILEELRNPEMRKWAWSIYKSGRSTNEKGIKKFKINRKREMRVLANLKKQIDQIERDKLRFNEQYTIDETYDYSTENEIDTAQNENQSYFEKFKAKLPFMSKKFKSKSTSFSRTGSTSSDTSVQSSLPVVADNKSLEIKVEYELVPLKSCQKHKESSKKNRMVSFASDMVDEEQLNKEFDIDEMKHFSEQINRRLMLIHETISEIPEDVFEDEKTVDI